MRMKASATVPSPSPPSSERKKGQRPSPASTLHSIREDEVMQRRHRTENRVGMLMEQRIRQHGDAHATRDSVIRREVTAASRTEQTFFQEVHVLSQWRDIIAENSALRRSQEALAEENMRKLRLDFLEGAQTREMNEFETSTENNRVAFRDALRDHERAKHDDAVEAATNAVQTVLDGVNAVVDYCGKYNIDRIGSGPMGEMTLQVAVEPLRSIAKLSVSDINWQSAKSSSPVSTVGSPNSYRPDGSFVDVYHCNPVDRTKTIPISEPEFISPVLDELAQLIYASSHPNQECAPRIEPSPKPVILVVGPPFSGKSVVASQIAEKLGMRCVSDRSLVEGILKEAGDESTGAGQQVAMQSSGGSVPALDSGMKSGFISRSELRRAIRSSLLAGEEVTSTEMCELILFAIEDAVNDESCCGIILDGIPAHFDSHVKLLEMFNGSHPEFTTHSMSTAPPANMNAFNIPHLSRIAEDSALRRRSSRAGHAVIVQREVSVVRTASESAEGEVGGIPTTATATTSASAAPTAAAASTSPDDRERNMPVLLGLVPPGNPALHVLKPQEVVAEDQTLKKESKKTKKRDAATDIPPPAPLPTVDELYLSSEDVELLSWFESQQHASATKPVFTSVIVIGCSVDEIFKRFAGLRLDVATGKSYHLMYRPPPPDRFPFLVLDDRTYGHATQFHHRVLQSMDRNNEVLHWLQQSGGVLATTVDGEQSIDGVVKDALSLAVAAKARAKASYERWDAGRQLHAKKLAHLETRKEQLCAREQERKRMIEVYNERGVSLPPEFLQSDAESNEYLPIPPHLPAVWLSSLSSNITAYIDAGAHTLSSLRELARSLHTYSSTCMGVLTEYWEQSDSKQRVLNAFSMEYNSLPLELRSCSETKAELHLRTDYLREILFGIIGLRMREALSIGDALHGKNAFAEVWGDAVQAVGATLVQVELNRFAALTNLVLLYFSSILGLPFIPSCAAPEVTVPLKTLPDTPTESPKAKEKRGGATKRTVQSRMEDGQDRTTDDIFLTAIDKATQYVTTTVMKFSPSYSSAPSAMAKKKTSKKTVREDGAPGKGGVVPMNELHAEAAGEETAAGNSPSSAPAAATAGASSAVLPSQTQSQFFAQQVGSPNTLSGPPYALFLTGVVMENLKEATLNRIRAIHTYIAEFLSDGEETMQDVAVHLQQEVRAWQLSQSSAVNSALFYVRNAIEEERTLGPLHLGCGSFAPLSPTQQPSSVTEDAAGASMDTREGSPTSTNGEGEDPESALSDPQQRGTWEGTDDAMLTPCLSAARFHAMIKSFRSLAPDYRLTRDDFSSIVHVGDYACALPSGSSNTHALLSPHELFDSFDPYESGIADWREFAVHLLLWSVSPNAGATGELAEFNSDKPPTAFATTWFISGPTATDLIDLHLDLGTDPLAEKEFSEISLYFDEDMSEERYMAYLHALWAVFEKNGTVDPREMLLFMCFDDQPVRGAQKAFYVGSLNATEGYTGVLTADEMDDVFHILANNDRSVSGNEFFTRENIDATFGDDLQLSFDGVCARHMGRALLTCSTTFLRKQFTR